MFGPRIFSLPTIRIGIPRSIVFGGEGDDSDEQDDQSSSPFGMMPRFGGMFDDMFSGMRQRMDGLMETMRKQTDALARGEVPAGTGKMVVIKAGPG